MTSFAAALITATIAPFTPQAVVLGPFPLGDLLLMTPDSWLVKVLKDGDLDLDDVKKEMNAWKLNVIDYKFQRPDGEWRWHRPEKNNNFPKLLVEGRLCIVVKTRTGKEVEISLAECKWADLAYDSSEMKSKKPMTVDGRLVFTFRFHNLAVKKTGGLSLNIDEGSTDSLPYVWYDIKGRSRALKSKPNEQVQNQR